MRGNDKDMMDTLLCGDLVNPAPKSSASKGVVRNMLGGGSPTSSVKSYGKDSVDYSEQL
jgi:hypothetical protein